VESLAKQDPPEQYVFANWQSASELQDGRHAVALAQTTLPGQVIEVVGEQFPMLSHPDSFS
jgi:hypothetical protein